MEFIVDQTIEIIQYLYFDQHSLLLNMIFIFQIGCIASKWKPKDIEIYEMIYDDMKYLFKCMTHCHFFHQYYKKIFATLKIVVFINMICVPNFNCI